MEKKPKKKIKEQICMINEKKNQIKFLRIKKL